MNSRSWPRRVPPTTVVRPEWPWYVPLALEWRRLQGAGFTACALALASCGGGGERQDANEPRGKFPVEVVSASFPGDQKLAKESDLVIEVRNAGDKVIPNIAVTVKGFDERRKDRTLADPNRPVFVINGRPKEIGTFPESKEEAPEGGETAYVGTWALGKLKPDETKTFRWNVTAVRPGPFKLKYEVAAGLDGKARAVKPSGGSGIPGGQFAGTIAEEAPDTRIGGDGETIEQGTPGGL